MRSMTNPARGRTRWVLIGWMFVLSAIAYLNRVGISIAGGSIEQDFHLNQIQLGWVFSAFTISLVLLSASIATEYTARRWLKAH